MANFRTLNGGIIEDTWQDISSEFDTSVLGTNGRIMYAKKRGHLILFAALIFDVTFNANSRIVVKLVKSTSPNKPIDTTGLSVFEGANSTPIVSMCLTSDGDLIIRSDQNVSGQPYYFSGVYYTNNP